jgi:hypothetical protein
LESITTVSAAGSINKKAGRSQLASIYIRVDCSSFASMASIGQERTLARVPTRRSMLRYWATAAPHLSG